MNQLADRERDLPRVLVKHKRKPPRDQTPRAGTAQKKFGGTTMFFSSLIKCGDEAGAWNTCEKAFRTEACAPLNLAVLVFFLAMVVATVPAAGQVDRWNDLSQRSAQLVAQGRPAEALPIARQALSVAESTFGKTHGNYGMSQNAVGYILMLMGNLDDAEAQLLAAKRTIESAAGPNNVNLLYPLGNLAQLYYGRANASQANLSLMRQYLEKSESYAVAALSITENNFGTDNAKLIPVLEGLAWTYSAERKLREAYTTLQRMLRIEKSNLPSDHVQIIRTETQLGWVLEQQGNRADALKMYQTALASAVKTLGDSDPFTISIKESVNRLTSGSSTGGSPPGGNAGQTEFLAALGQVIQGSQNRFAQLKRVREEDIDGDRTWRPTVLLPRATNCTIWNYRDRTLGSSYVRSYKRYPSESLAAQDYNDMKRTVAGFLGAQWSARESSGARPQVTFTDPPSGTKVRVSLDFCGIQRCEIKLWVETER
jgi:tetratricopeptide (TPR) repeat protein